MASLTRSQLKTSSNNTYDTNGVGGITAAEVRTFNDDLIDSLITNDLTGSMSVATASLALTASSVSNGVLASLNSFTASATVRLNNLESTSASVNVSISNLNSATSSYAISASVAAVDAAQQQQINSLIAASSSYANSASFAASQLVQDGRLNNLESTSASLLIKTNNLEIFSASALVSINALNTNSASVNTSITNLNSATQSLQAQLATIGGQSGSWITESETGSFAITGSNTFRGNQTISGSLNVSGALNVVGDGVNNNNILFSPGGRGIRISDTNIAMEIDSTGVVEIYSDAGQAGIKLTPGGTFGNGRSFINFDTLGGTNHDIMSIEGATTNTSASIQIKQANQNLLIAEYGPLTQTRFYNKVDVSGSVDITGSLSASLNQGYVWVGNANNRTVLVSTSSLAISIDTASFATTASFNSYTSSTDVRLNNLESTSASLLVETSNLETFSASALVSISNLNTNSASVNTSISALNGFTASQSTASLVTSITELNTFSASALISINNLNAATASYVTETESGSFLITASFDNGTRNLTFTKGNNTTFAVNIPDVSGSAGNFVTTASFNAYTASNDQRVSSLETNSASVNTSISNINQFTSSANQRLNAIESVSGSWVTESETASFARTNVDNNFTANQTFTNITAVSASFTYVQTLYETSSVIYSSGSNQLGDELTDIQTLSGSVKIRGGLLINDLDVTQSINNINTATQSLFVSASLALVTASVTNDDITFTKGDGTQFTIQVATGSFALSASYAETASYAQFATDIYLNVKNTTGAQLNKGTVVRIIGATGDNALIATASWEDDNNSANTLGLLYENIANDAFGKVITQGTLLGIDTDPTLGYTAGQLVYLSSSGQYTNVAPPAPYHEVRLGQVLRAQQNNGSIYVLIQNGYELAELHDVDINTGSLANNNLLAYNSSSTQWENKTLTQVGATTTASFNSYTSSNDQRVSSLEVNSGSVNTSITNLNSFTQSANVRLNNLESTSASLLVETSNLELFSASALTSINSLNAATASFVTENETGSFVVTASFNNSSRDLTFTRANQAIFVVNIPDTSGSVLVNPSIETISGSVLITANSFTSGAANILHLTSSANLANIVLKTNNNTATTIISGSGNIFTNTGNPTAGFRRYLTAGNISTMGALPQISASMQFSPTITNNTFLGTATTTNPLTIRGPISSSAYNINSNYLFGSLNLGSSATNHAERIVAGATISTNLIQSLNIIANRTNLTQPVAIQANQLQGTTTLNMNSSSIDLNNNLWFGLNTITNNSSGSSRVSAAGNAAGLVQNIMLGGNTVTFSGSNDPSDTSDTDYNGGIYRSMIIGTNTPFILTGPTGSNSIANTGIIGNGLIVTGSSGNPVTLTDSLRHGSLFAGRFNALGTRNLSSENVFVVGTGASTSARKTGFLIDSASNTFVEGTLNVSGSSLSNVVNITGSVDISGSTTIRGNFQVTTGSFSVFGNIITTNGVFSSSIDGGLYIDNIGYVGSGSAGGFFIGTTTQDLKIQNWYSSSVDGKNIVIENFSPTGSSSPIFGKVALRARGVGGAVTIENTSNFRVECNSEITGSLKVSGSLAAAGDFKLGRGTDKPTNKVTVGTGGLIVSNSLVTSDSYIFATADTTVGNYSPVVSNITSGSFSLSNGGYAGNISVMYMIVNPY